ncbi:MAG: transcriptional repressor [Polyangiales bacterium]
MKLTHQRLEIFRELAGTEAHPNAETVFRGVQRRVPTVSLDTVYRTLWMLHDLGLVTTLGPQRDGVRFDANLERHHHYVCVQCGLVRDFESEELNRLRVPASVSELGSIVHAQVEVHGLCEQCQKRPEPAPRSRSQRKLKPANTRSAKGARHE